VVKALTSPKEGIESTFLASKQFQHSCQAQKRELKELRGRVRLARMKKQAQKRELKENYTTHLSHLPILSSPKEGIESSCNGRSDRLLF